MSGSGTLSSSSVSINDLSDSAFYPPRDGKTSIKFRAEYKMAMVSVVNWQPTGELMVQADRLGPKVGGHLEP